jgi:hypothetical protein
MVGWKVIQVTGNDSGKGPEAAPGKGWKPPRQAKGKHPLLVKNATPRKTDVNAPKIDFDIWNE